MYEVEVKVSADLERVRDRLDERGAERRARVEQTDTYYDAPHRDFAATDEALRVRREVRDGQDEARITYKGPLVEQASKTREEIETGVADGDDADAIFRALGFERAATVRKERERFTVGEFTVTLDAVEEVGEFVEVETEVESGIESAREDAYEVLRGLGLDPDDQIRTSYLGLLLSDEE